MRALCETHIHIYSDDVKLLLFRTFCYNLYGGHIWSSYRSKDMFELTKHKKEKRYDNRTAHGGWASKMEL